MKTHLVIPDVQFKEGVPSWHLPLIGRYILEKKPDVIVCIGDFADMPSLCFYDKTSRIKSFEGRRYKKDIEAVKKGMDLLLDPIREYNKNQSKNHKKSYSPRMVMLIGNHEDRISRAIEQDPSHLDGMISLKDLGYEEAGWEVHPFLEIIEIDGIQYSHYFTSGVMGRPVNSAQGLLREQCKSATMGHVQHTDIAIHKKTKQIGLFCGTCYLHDEDYLGAQGNNQRRHIIMKYRVNDGVYDPHFVSLDYLKEHFEKLESKDA